MATLPSKAKENGEETTPLQNRRGPAPPPSLLVGRSFGTPLSNCSAVQSRSVSTSKKVQLRQEHQQQQQQSSSSSTSSLTSTSKKIVRARKLVQQHRTPTAAEIRSFSSSTSFASPSVSSAAATPLVANTADSITFVVNFLPGLPMGIQLEPTTSTNLGVRVNQFHDGGIEEPGQARRNQVEVGDILLEINDKPICHLKYDYIVNQLKAMNDLPRKILFRRSNRTDSGGEFVESGVLPPPHSAPPKQFCITSNGAATPVVSPPKKGEETMGNEKKSVSSILFGSGSTDSSQTPSPPTTSPKTTMTTTPPPLPGTATTDVTSPPHNVVSPRPVESYSPVPESPSYTLLPQDSIASVQSNVVLDVNDDEADDDNNKDESIDTTSTISPSKVKNISQEDLELGLGRHRGSSMGNNKSNKTNGSMVTVLRNVYRTYRKLAGESENKSPPTQDHSLVVVDDKEADTRNMILQEKQQEGKKEDALVLHPKRATNDNYGRASGDLHQARDEETKKLEWLEEQLSEANNRVEALQREVDLKQEEMDRRVQDAKKEAKARVEEISEMQLSTNMDLQQKLQESNANLEMRIEAFLSLERDLQEANAKVTKLSEEKTASMAELESIKHQMKELEANKDSQKSTQLEAQLQVAKLQTELRDEKKETDRLKSAINLTREQHQEIQNRLEDAQTKLKANQEEIERSQCIMETYEERFVEREERFEVLTEEKDFAARELEFARSEIQRLQASLQKRDSDFERVQAEFDSTKQDMSEQVERLEGTISQMTERATSTENEINRLREGVDMASKELEDQQQQSYDREQELQAQLTQHNAELQQAQSKLALAADQKRELEDELSKRDADLASLKLEIKTTVSNLQDELQQKEKSLEVVASTLESTKEEHQKLLQEQETQTMQLSQAISELQAAASTRDEELAGKSNELVSAKETLALTQQEAKELKETANEIFQEKSRVTKELSTLKFEISDMRVKATKTQDALLQRAKQMDAKAKEAQAQLKKKENEELAVLSRLERAQQKIDSLSANLEQTEMAIETFTSEIKSLEETTDNLRRREAQLKADLEEKEHEKQAAQADLRISKSTVFEASSRISFLERQLNEFEAQKTISAQENAGLKHEVATLSEKVDSQRVSLDKVSWELSTRSMEVMNLESSLENLQEELKQKKEELDTAQKSLATAKAQYTQLNDCLKASAEESTSKIQSLTADLIAAQDEVADHVTKAAKLERQVVTMKQQIQDSEDQMSELRSQLVVETEKGVELVNANDAQRKEHVMKQAELLEEVEKRSALADKLEKECQARTSDNAELVVEIANLEQKLSNSRALFGSEDAKHKKERSEFEEALSSQKQEVTQLTLQLEGTEEALESARKQLKDTEIRYEDELLIMRNSTASKDSKLSELFNEREENTKAISRCKEELSLARLEIQRSEERGRRSRDEVASLQSLMDTLQSDHVKQQEGIIASHSAEREQLLKDKEQVDSSIRKLKQTQLMMQNRMQELERVIESEREKNDVLSLEQDALTTSLRRAEDLVAELTCELNILKEEQANQSIDSLDSQTLSLSKSELRMKCKYLSEEVQDAETRAASGKSSLAQKQKHIQRLEEDVKELAAELERMVECSAQLETALLKARMDKANADADADTLRTSIEAQSAKTNALKEELQACENENLEFSEKLRDCQMLLQASKEREESVGQDLEKTRQTLQLLSDENNEGRNEIARISQELTTANEKREGALAQIGDLEYEIASLEEKLATTAEEKELLQSESRSVEERFDNQLRELRNESSGLRSTIASLESEIENQVKTIHSLEESKMEEQEKLEAARKYGLKMETSREEAVTKLTEASRVLAAQKGIISMQEARAVEAEEKTKKLSQDVCRLKEALQSLESATEETGLLRSTHFEELEKKRALLEKAKTSAKAEAERLHDELRATNRKVSELNRINKAQETRINELKSAAEATKAQLREARGAWAESENLSRSLENEVQQSKAENDSLRAKLTLTGANIARLKSDRALLQEAVVQTESKSKTKNIDGDGLAKEVTQIKAMLLAKEQEVSTHKVSVRNLKKIVSGMKTTEVELVTYIEGILVEVQATFDDLSEISRALEGLGPQKCTQATDPGTPEKVFDEASCCIGRLVSVIKEASGKLEGKRQHLDNWKASFGLHTTTPKAKSSAPAALLTPNGTSAMRTFRKLREVVETKNSSSDNEQVHAVIMSLEGQIESLCAELKAANVALQAKDKAMAEQQSRKDSGMLSAIQEASEDDKEKLKSAAVRSLAKVLENRNKANASSGLRQLAMSAAVTAATGEQKHAMEALSKTLETTREKLVVLKMQHRKNKASSNSNY